MLSASYFLAFSRWVYITLRSIYSLRKNIHILNSILFIKILARDFWLLVGKFSFTFGYPVSSSKSRREGGYKWEGVRKERKDAGISRDRKMDDKYLRIPNDYKQKEYVLYKIVILVKFWVPEYIARFYINVGTLFPGKDLKIVVILCNKTWKLRKISSPIHENS